MRKLLGLPFFICFVSHAFCQNNLPPVYEIKTDTTYIKLPDSCWQMLEDGKGKWTIDQVSQSSFSKNFHADTNISYPISTYWMRYRLKSDLPQEVKIYFSGFAPLFDLYTKQGDSSWQHQKTGHFVPWSERDGIKNNYRLPLVIKPGQELLVYQRFKFELRFVPKRLTTGFGFTDQLLKTRYVLNEADYFDNIKRGITFGICMLAAIFSFFFFLTAREWVYFHAAMLYLFTASFSFIDGVVGVFFREHQGMISFYGQYFAIPPFLYFLVSTVRNALETKRLYPGWDKYLFTLSLTPFIWIIGQYFYIPLDKWGIVVPILIFLSVIITSFKWVRKKNKTAKLLIAGLLFFSVFELMSLLSESMDLSLPVWWNEREVDVVLICYFWIIATSSWMLFERYRQLQKKVLQEAFEKEQLAKEKEIERRELVEQQKEELEKQVAERTSELKHSLEELKSTQSQLIQSEKMASLGELTAGIAHEIQNPLNFVNNFSEVNRELIEELEGERSKVNGERNEELENEILTDVKQNLEKISHHGKRADAIVKGMLQHSRTSSGQKELTDINALCDEYLRLAYHGLRAKDKSFNADFTTVFDLSIGKINIVRQDIGRALLNLINNAFYAVNKKARLQATSYEPTVKVSTKRLSDKPDSYRVEITVTDNGDGIPKNIVDKIFQPFFTTKPTGQGTGLGLSLAYDIIKAHGGEIKVETIENVETKFIIQLPNQTS